VKGEGVSTSSKVSNKVSELARSKNVILIENVNSEEDIIRELKNTKLFD